MSGIFHRQLAQYADYHRDQRNCLMHFIGNPILFVAAVLPLSLLSVTVFGVQTSAAILLVIPALILWISWDVGLGLAMVATAIPLLLIATIIANHVSVAAIWIITALLTTSIPRAIAVTEMSRSSLSASSSPRSRLVNCRENRRHRENR